MSQGTTSQLSEILGPVEALKGRDFSRANKANKMSVASAPAG
jgi:hypothetical protein